MDKLVFWVTVALAGAAGVFIIKTLAAQTNVQGLRAFANAL